MNAVSPQKNTLTMGCLAEIASAMSVLRRCVLNVDEGAGKDMKVIVKQMFMMDSMTYQYKRVWLYREYDIPFTPVPGMLIDVSPYMIPQPITQVTWNTKKDNLLEAWMETKDYGKKDCKKDKKKLKKGETTESMSKFEKDIKLWKSWGWKEEVEEADDNNEISKGQ